MSGDQNSLYNLFHQANQGQRMGNQNLSYAEEFNMETEMENNEGDIRPLQNDLSNNGVNDERSASRTHQMNDPSPNSRHSSLPRYSFLPRDENSSFSCIVS